jgi:hypothetical protein
MKQGLLAILLVVWIGWTAILAFEVPNADFEQGQGEQMPGWQLSAQPGAVVNNGRGNSRAIAVTGDGNGANHWLSKPLPFEPGGIYLISFWARGSGAGGTAVSGPLFANVDLGMAAEDWRRYENVVAAPVGGKEINALRFGQWHVKGTIMFDEIKVAAATAVYHREQGLTLGEGEKISVNEYTFTAPFFGVGRNHSRPLWRHTAGYNSNRWVFGQGAEVIYRHQIEGRKQLQAKLNVNIGYYVNGQLRAEASRNGEDWRQVGTKMEKGALEVELPAELFPAEQIFLKLKADSSWRVGAAASDPGSFQINSYSYCATISGPPSEINGSTSYVQSDAQPEGVAITLLSLGDLLPGGDNFVQMTVANRRPKAILLAASSTVERIEDGQLDVESLPAVQIEAGQQQTLRLPYSVRGMGTFRLTMKLSGDISYSAENGFMVPCSFGDYGEILRAADGQATLWWASSGWKIPRRRALPQKTGQGLTLSAARNEAEAVQLVLTPERAMAAVEVTCSDLRGSGQARISREQIDVLRVHYSAVTTKTDQSGMTGLWPDALPPLRGPLSLEAGVNQPFWVRVRVPENAQPGNYQGTITVRDRGGWSEQVPLFVEVHPFALPSATTCETAFGFSPGMVWRYQKLDDPAQRREVMQKYWRNFQEHRISPYNPAPFSSPKITLVDGRGLWQGGERDAMEKFSGRSSLYLNDISTTGKVRASYDQHIEIPAQGVRLRFKYKTGQPDGEFLVTFTHYTAPDKWMSRKNHDIRVVGDGTWQTFDQEITTFPPGAKGLRLAIWATLWSERGEHTGSVWIDDLELLDRQTKLPLLTGGDFEPLSEDKLRVAIDWEAWDQEMAEALERYDFNSFNMSIQGLGGGTYHARRKPTLLGYQEGSREYQLLMADYLRQVQQHLEEKGWLDKAYVYWFDEPDQKDYEYVMNGFNKLKTHAPKLRRMLTEQVEEALIGGPNLWCPLTPHVNPEIVKERNQHGERFWWYVCVSPKAPYTTLFIDHPGTELRVWLWQTWKFGVDGILVWQSNYWTSDAAYPNQPQNPYLDPMGWVSGYSTPKGTKTPWGNGDGRFVYPPEAAADANPDGPILDGPVDSIRWEMLRDGLEDYEYLAILKRLLEEKQNELAPARRAELEKLLAVPESICKSLSSFTTDPAPIEQQRYKIARAITALMK